MRFSAQCGKHPSLSQGDAAAPGAAAGPPPVPARARSGPQAVRMQRCEGLQSLRPRRESHGGRARAVGSEGPRRPAALLRQPGPRPAPRLTVGGQRPAAPRAVIRAAGSRPGASAALSLSLAGRGRVRAPAEGRAAVPVVRRVARWRRESPGKLSLSPNRAPLASSSAQPFKLVGHVVYGKSPWTGARRARAHTYTHSHTRPRTDTDPHSRGPLNRLPSPTPRAGLPRSSSQSPCFLCSAPKPPGQ